jgi:uncharacterized membrane protein YqjE
MKLRHHRRAIGTLAIAVIAAGCLLAIIAVGSIPEYRWLAALIGMVAFTWLGALGSAWSITIAEKQKDPSD